jgi:ABC transport permease subunit
VDAADGRVGWDTIPVVLLTCLFTGMVLALQTFRGFERFHAEGFVGSVVALSLTRELAPVLTGLMAAGRVGSAMAAELGTMRVTEQIDALYAMATEPIHYLVVPRVNASILMLPLLTLVGERSESSGLAGRWGCSAPTATSTSSEPSVPGGQRRDVRAIRQPSG